jgi:hypothetical protein
MLRRLLLLLAPVCLGTAPPVDFAAIRSVDARMGAIAHRLLVANAALCRERAPAPGLVLHALGQYGERAAAERAFGFATPVAVEAVVPGSPAARGGIAEDDGLVAVAGTPVTGGAAGAADRDAASAAIEAQPADAPLRLTLRRGGQERAVTLDPLPGCRSRVEVLLGPGMSATADGLTVQVSVGFLARYDDAQVAVIVAHELAHNILRHRARLEAAGVSRGVLKEFGRNGRLFRRTEEEADRLGAHLLRNAGWDPAGAVAFWRDHGGEIDHGLFRARTHAASPERARVIAAEVAAIPARAPVPYLPPLLGTRDDPLQ